MVGRGGRKARRLSLTRTPALFPLFRRRFFGLAAQTKGSDVVSVNKAPHSRTRSPVCIARRRNQCLKACVYRRQLYKQHLTRKTTKKQIKHTKNCKVFSELATRLPYLAPSCHSLSSAMCTNISFHRRLLRSY